MTFARRRNRLTTHFSERIPVVKRRMTVYDHVDWRIVNDNSEGLGASVLRLVHEGVYSVWICPVCNLKHGPEFYLEVVSIGTVQVGHEQC